VTSRIRQWLVDPGSIYQAIRFVDPSAQRRLIARAEEIGRSWSELPAARQRTFLTALIERIDVGAKQEIYDMLRGLTDAGVAILMISSDMEEVIGVSDRIAVMHEGAISGFLDRSQFNEHNVLQLAVGHTV